MTADHGLGQRLASALVALLAGWIPVAAWGDPGGRAVLVGVEFEVNTYVTGHQLRAAVAADADGDFVVVWHTDVSPAPDTGYSVQGQCYASDGTKQGSEFQVNSYTTSWQDLAAVAADADGDFVVVWQSLAGSGSDQSVFSVQGQRYASDGSPRGSQFQVNTHTTSYQWNADVAVAADGDFVVVWDSLGSSGSDQSSYSIQGQRYASDGTALGGEFQINTYTTDRQWLPAVAAEDDGDFVVVWQSAGSSGSDQSFDSIQGRRFASDGSPRGSQFQVNTATTDSQRSPAVAVDADGDFVVAWWSYAASGPDSDGSVLAQRYASDGTAAGSEFRVNTYTTGRQMGPGVAADADGDVVVVWDSAGSSGSDQSSTSIQGQRYRSDGTALASEFQVNSYTTSSQYSPAVAAEAGGDFVVVWQGDGCCDQHGIHGQRFLPTEIFADGFESGDTSRWSNTVSTRSGRR